MVRVRLPGGVEVRRIIEACFHAGLFLWNVFEFGFCLEIVSDRPKFNTQRILDFQEMKYNRFKRMNYKYYDIAVNVYEIIDILHNSIADRGNPIRRLAV